MSASAVLIIQTTLQCAIPLRNKQPNTCNLQVRSKNHHTAHIVAKNAPECLSNGQRACWLHDKRKDKVAEEDPITNQRLPTFQGETGGGGREKKENIWSTIFMETFSLLAVISMPLHYFRNPALKQLLLHSSDCGISSRKSHYSVIWLCSSLILNEKRLNNSATAVNNPILTQNKRKKAR